MKKFHVNRKWLKIKRYHIPFKNWVEDIYRRPEKKQRCFMTDMEIFLADMISVSEMFSIGYSFMNILEE